MKKILLRLLICIFALSMACFSLVACGGGAKLEVLNPPIRYQVGDNVDVFDLFSYYADQEYSFSYSLNEGESIDVEGEAIYLKEYGNYQVIATATKGNSKKTATTEILVTDGLATVVINNNNMTIAYKDSMSVKALLGRASISVTIDADYTTFIESVIIKNTDGDGTVYNLVEKEPTPGMEDTVYKRTDDGFFNGKVFNFLYECEYQFKVTTITTGGKVSETLYVKASESFAGLTEFSGLTFNNESLTANWKKIDGAVKYRVKVANRAKEVAETSFNIEELLSNGEFHFFDLIVVPEDENGNRLGFMRVKDVIITPEGSEGVVIGKGATIDGKTKTVSLVGGESYSNGWQTGVSKLNNSHISYYGDYGVGTFVEFTFKGNNLPQVCFFADNINGNMTQEGGSGYLLMNGLYTPNKGASTSTTQVVAEDRLVVLGPNRLTSEYPYNNYLVAAEQSIKFLMSKGTLFTQKQLREDTSGRTYRYVVGSFNNGGMLAFAATLYDVETNKVVVDTATYTTTCEVEEVIPGHIIVYASVKGEGNDTVFTYSKLPYLRTDLGDGSSYGVIDEEESEGIKTVTLRGQYPTGGIGWFSGIQATLKNSYVTIEGEHGVGTYVDFIYKGNNMPQVMLFADKANCIMTSGAQDVDGQPKYNGYLLINGIYGKTSKGTQLNYGNSLMCFGPNRISGDANYLVSASALNKYRVTTNKYFTQDFLSTDNSDVTYKYTVGSYVDVDGNVIIDVSIKDLSTGNLLAFIKYKTNKTQEELETLGDKIVVYGAVKGEDCVNEFSYGQPYQVERENQTISSGAYFSADGSVYLENKYPTDGIGWFYGINKTLDNSYIAFEGGYGVGTYVDFAFKGNNMPQVMLFANNINGNLTQGGDSSSAAPINNGYLLINGIYGKTASGTQLNFGDKLMCFGPNRMSSNSNYLAAADKVKAFVISSNQYFTQNYLSADSSGTEYIYTVGSYESKSGVIIEVLIKDAKTEKALAVAEYNTGKTKDEIEGLGGNIIAYATVKGGEDMINFSFKEPYAVERKQEVISSGAIFNSDGSVDLEVRYPTGGIGWLSGVSKTLNNSYIAFEGEYGVGTYIDFTFTGNNMPQVALFANEINGNMSCGNASGADFTENGAKYKGYIIMNGLYGKTASGTQVNYGDRLLCMGPYRIHSGVAYNEGVANISKVTITSIKKEFTQNYLSSDTSGIVYKYTVGSFIQGETVHIDVALYNSATGDEIAKATYDTGKTEAEVEGLGGNIIVYGCVKGSSGTTTFSYSEPYEKQA